jgi:hypothetical protein
LVAGEGGRRGRDRRSVTVEVDEVRSLSDADVDGRDRRSIKGKVGRVEGKEGRRDALTRVDRAGIRDGDARLGGVVVQ